MIAPIGPSRRTTPWKDDMWIMTTLSPGPQIRSGMGKAASYRPADSIKEDEPDRPLAPSL